VTRSILVRALIALLLPGGLLAPASAQIAGDTVRVRTDRPEIGVPIHRQCGVTSTKQERLAHGSLVTILEVCPTHPTWYLVEQGEVSGWLVRRYIDPAFTPAPPSGPELRIATWNLEHCRDHAARGFPEYTGSDAIPHRTPTEYGALAETIRDLGLGLIVLQEIGGEDPPDEEGFVFSSCLQQLRDALAPASFRYAVASSGGSQRLAFLYDTDQFFLNWTCEPQLADEPRVDGARLFARQPFLGFFTALRDGQEMNDFIAVGVHLASGQHRVKNHTIAMERIVGWIDAERNAGNCVPANEYDILIAGDFNSNRFGPRIAAFWSSMEASGWKTLAGGGETYPATRLSGRPPRPRDSRIDYIIVSDLPGGLFGEEIQEPGATVHAELIAGPEPSVPDFGLWFRVNQSDHLPVSFRMRVIPDND
jgi:hypothetical protein